MKFWNYMMIMLTMMVFLFFIGINPAGVDTVLNDVGMNISSETGELIRGDISNSPWYTELFNTGDGILFALIAGAALFIGIWTRSFDWKIALLPFFVVFIIKFIGFGYSIVSLGIATGETWLIGILATVFLPLTVMFIVSIVEWFGTGNT